MNRMLLLAAGLMLSAAVTAQETATGSVPVAPIPEKIVEGATADKVARIETCQGHKFESLVEIDPVRKRTTRIKLCANPGATDAEWVKTVEAAIVQIEQRNMPPEAKDKLIGELRAEVAKFAAPAKPMAIEGLAVRSDRDLIAPTERFETTSLPPLPERKLAAKAGTITSAGTAAASPPVRPMSLRLKCLAARETGAGSTCDYFDRDTTLVVSVIGGLEEGGTLRFRRRGEVRGEVRLAAMQSGRSTRVKLPSEVCRGVSGTKVEIELLAPKATSASARLGPYGVRC